MVEGDVNMKVLVTELMWEDGIKDLRSKGYEVDYDPELSRKREDLISLLPNYDAIIVRNETKVDTEFLEAAKKTQIIGRLGVGLDNIDLMGARERDIPVVSARNANATSVAEYVLAAMLDSSRPLTASNKDVRAGNWNRKLYTGIELNNRIIGLIGMGEISHRVAKRAIAFGMDVVGFDPFVAPFDHVVQETGIRQLNTVEELLKISDFISVHVPLLDSTKHLLNRNAFKQMKEDAIVINSARGGIVNETDIVEAIKNNEIAGAYLDVLEKEPIDKNSPLLTSEGIVLSPHIAGLTEEAQSRTAMLISEEVDRVLKGGKSLCQVN